MITTIIIGILAFLVIKFVVVKGFKLALLAFLAFILYKVLVG